MGREDTYLCLTHTHTCLRTHADSLTHSLTHSLIAKVGGDTTHTHTQQLTHTHTHKDYNVLFPKTPIAMGHMPLNRTPSTSRALPEKTRQKEWREREREREIQREREREGGKKPQNYTK